MIDFSDHFTYRKLLKYSFPPIVTMVFTSIYGVVDGLFLSNFAGKTAFAAVNFILPYIMVFGCFGFMFGTGGSALIAKTMGEGDRQKSNELFSLLTLFSVLCGVIMTLVGLATLRPVAVLLGAKDALLEDSILYGRIYLLGVPACIVQYEFQNLYATAGKPKLGMYSTLVSGMTNIVLDAVFVAGLSWGLVGAAAATVLSQLVGAVIPIVYFSGRNSSFLHFVRAKFDGRALGQICLNGASEAVNNVSISLVSMLYNLQLLKYAGNDGIAAYGVLMYVNFMFTAIFWGYLTAVSPIISYQLGAKNDRELKSVLRKSLVIIGAFSVLMFASAELFARPVSILFTGYDNALLEITERGFLLFSFSFIFAGYAIFSSSFFTALNDGLRSALISALRVFAFQMPAVLLLPLLWELDGIWLSLVLAEFLTAAVGAFLITANRRKYHYL